MDVMEIALLGPRYISTLGGGKGMKEVFEYKGSTVAVIPNAPRPAEMNVLTNG